MACYGLLSASEGETNVRLTLDAGGTTSVGWRFLLRWDVATFDIEDGFPAIVEVRTDGGSYGDSPGRLARIVTDPGVVQLADADGEDAFGLSPYAPFYLELLIEASDDVHAKWWAQAGSEPGAYILDSTLAGQSLDHIDLVHRVTQLAALRVLAVHRQIDGGAWELVDDLQRTEGGDEFGTPNGDVATDGDWVSDDSTDNGIAGIVCETSLAWDAYAAALPNGDILATIQNDAEPVEGATERGIRVALDEPGSGTFKINRYSPVGGSDVLMDGNIVKVRLPWRDDYDFAFILEKSDLILASAKEHGGEELTWGGRGILAYLERAIMDAVAYTTGVIVADVWTQVWQSGAIAHPVGIAFDADEPDDVYVLDGEKRRIYRLNQTTRKAVAVSPVLFSGRGAGLSFDPSDPTIAWVLEAPWLSGSGADTQIHKLDRSDWSIITTLAEPDTATQLTDIRADASFLWTSRYDAGTIQKRDKTDGSVVDSSTITYNGNVQEHPNGIAINGTAISYWFGGTANHGTGRALLADTSDPWTITGIQKTTGIAGYGGDQTTEGGDEFIYIVSTAVGRVWKYQLSSATPVDPVDGIWRLDEEGTPGGVLWRIIQEAIAGARPRQPLPDLTIDFSETNDSATAAWDAADGTAEFDAKITDAVLATAIRLIPYGLVLRMSPRLLFQAFNRAAYGVDRTGAFGADTVRFEKGVNIIPELGRQGRERALHSHLLVLGQSPLYAWGELDDLGYVREGGMTTDLANQTAIEGTAAATLADERVRKERIRLAVPIGDDPENGKYLPFTHYNVGDLITLHTGDGDRDWNEAAFVLYAFTLEEGKAGKFEQAYVELAAATLTGDLPGASSSGGSSGGGSAGTGGGAGGSSSGGSSGGSSSTTSAQPPTVQGTDDSGAVLTTATGRTIRSVDWSVYQIATGVVGVALRGVRRLLGLDDVDADGIVDGQTLAWDTDRFVAAFLEALKTAATDATLVLSPDGTGGVTFRAEAGGGGALASERFDAAGGAPETVTLAEEPTGSVIVFVNGVEQDPDDVAVVGADVSVNTTAGDVVVVVYGVSSGGSSSPVIIRGELAGDGSITKGTGFSAVQDVTGQYTVTFDTPFATAPIVLVSPFFGGSSTQLVAGPGVITTADVTIFTGSPGVGFADLAFSFIAMEAAV